MTEYGRGQGSEPWHPEDPLNGDGGWRGQQAHTGQQPAYDGQQQYPQQPQQQYGDWGGGQQAAYGQAQQQYPNQYGQQQFYAGQGQPYDNSGWATGTHTQVQYTDPTDPYGQPSPAYGGRQSDYYGTPDAYPPPQPPGRRRAEPEPEPDWDPGPDQGEHAFFSGRDDDADDDLDDPREGRGDRGNRKGRGGQKPKKRRGGCACLVLTVILAGGVGGVGYFGYQFYQDRFGPAPDFAGDGNGEQVTVVIPKGAVGSVIGQKLKEAGVVESVGAFVSAQASNPDGMSIQDGVYTLQKQMSAASAVELMLNPKSRSNLIIAEGSRNAAVYALIDKRLGVADGTTAKVAKNEYKSLGLPDWALGHANLKDPLEGFLYPSSYAATKGQKPEAVLKSMVARANDTYEKLGLEKKAKSLGLDGPWQLLTVASLVQAEGTSHDDFRKMAEVVYNRLKPGNPETYGALEFDSTYNYVKNQSKIDLSISELRKYDNPYNTYFHKGLPPGPIDNPGEDALRGALNPTDDGWYYFISMDGKTSKFTKTLKEHQKLVNEWNASRN
ncbi:endolytic transglycosylase MltG [Streptomyces sp. HUCO-GS316]|uniref:endolytic transglycosylase MltG n=1 Tax=Streptomyces sp. HUCO-GS316 TaxID=2692198 RepID=UPI00136E4C70|nr:endolytic transglycosylase MltG [Streptomyces sp. HUCO-GS316]MXM63785.1 endolytic transglycosylase MltG [Streptomyces sp. HUCO-GS316]